MSMSDPTFPMNRWFRRFLTALAVLPACAALLRAQAPEPTIVVVGTTIQSPLDGSHWGYLSWLASKPELLRDRPYAVYVKDGGADDALPFRHLGTVRPQTDPAAVTAMFERSRHLGQDQAKLQEAISAYFDQLHPDAGVPVPDMLGALTAQSMQDDGVYQMLVFMGRAHPGVALSLGTGFAARIHNGVSTFELREKPPGSEEFSAVVGRITVTAGQPFAFSAPGAPVVVPSADRGGNALPAGDVTNHLNVKLRWASPDLLRRQSLLLRGFHVYRVTRAYAEARGWHGCPAPPVLATVDWDEEVASGFPQVAKVNRLPILPRRFYTDTEVVDFDLDDGDGIKGDLDFYTQDDNRHNGLKLDEQGNGIDVNETFVPGAEYYYYVAGEDLLGRRGSPSCGTLVKICDRDPPNAVKGVRVTNDFVFNNATQSSDQRLRVTWNQLPASDGAVAYFVYRWRSLPDFRAAELLDPLSLGAEHLVAGPIAHTGPGKPLTVVDNADPLYSPKIGASPQFAAAGDDAGRTIWYTVVAVDDSVCGGNFSPHSAPADGVLRDRVAPLDGGGSLAIRCCTPNLEPLRNQSTTSGPPTQDPQRMYFKLDVARTGQEPAELRTVEFWLDDIKNGLTYPIATADFPSNPAELLVITPSIPRPAAAGGTYFLRGKVIQSDGRESPVAEVPITDLPPFFYHVGSFVANRDCRRVPLRLENEPCTTHEAAPQEGGDINPIEIQIEFAVSSREWRLYRTIDGGPLTLIRQGLLGTPAIANQFLILQDPVFSPVGGEVCYFIQYFDEHGNGGPMKDLGCVKFTGKPPQTPVVARIQPLEIGGVKKARLRWFCPTVGVERFEVRVTRTPGPPPPGLSAGLEQTGSCFLTLPGDGDGPITVKAGKRYETGVVGHTLTHNGPEFTLILDEIEVDALHHVGIVAVGTNGLKSSVSNVVDFVWESPEVIVLPEVKWPARPLPPGTKPIDWDSRIEAKYLANLVPGLQRVGVRIGQDFGPRVCALLNPDLFDPANPVFALSGNIDPVTRVFTQGDWTEAPGVPPPPRLLPAMLYRYQVPNALFDQVSNDIVQVTPLIETIAYRYETPVATPLSNCNGVRIYDPFIAVTSAPAAGGAGTDLAFDLWLMDSMPVSLGARYAYLLVVFRENGEIRTVIPAGEVEISTNP
jgi:hypothetical protein